MRGAVGNSNAPSETKTTLDRSGRSSRRLVSSVRRHFPVMSLTAILVIAFGMSVDAFAAALAKGAALHRPRVSEAIRTGLVFGIIEAITPIVGWAAGLAAASFVAEVDHWIALILLGAVGGKMIRESLSRSKAKPRPDHHSLLDLATTAVGTSIDAMAVGVTLAFLDAQIVVVAAAIGFATFTMTATGVLLGRYAGHQLGKWAEMAGGVGLIALGVWIFVQHTMGV